MRSRQALARLLATASTTGARAEGKVRSGGRARAAGARAASLRCSESPLRIFSPSRSPASLPPHRPSPPPRPVPTRPRPIRTRRLGGTTCLCQVSVRCAREGRGRGRARRRWKKKNGARFSLFLGARAWVPPAGHAPALRPPRRPAGLSPMHPRLVLMAESGRPPPDPPPPHSRPCETLARTPRSRPLSTSLLPPLLRAVLSLQAPSTSMRTSCAPWTAPPRTTGTPGSRPSSSRCWRTPR